MRRRDRRGGPPGVPAHVAANHATRYDAGLRDWGNALRAESRRSRRLRKEIEAMENQEPPQEKQDDKQYSAYVSPRLRSKIDSRYEDDEEKSGAGGTIALVGLIAV